MHSTLFLWLPLFLALPVVASESGQACSLDPLSGMCTGLCSCGNCYMSKHGTCGCDGAFDCGDGEPHDDCSCGGTCTFQHTCQPSRDAPSLAAGTCECAPDPDPRLVAPAPADPDADPFPSWTLHFLRNDPDAVCLDGSPGAYYLEHGAEAGKWMIHLQGGGWCTSLADCAARSKTALGSSAGYAADKAAVLGGYDGGAHGLFSSDPDVNPLFHNWTKVYVRYCDGASFAGNVASPQFFRADDDDDDSNTTATRQPQPLYFRGRRILDAVMGELLADDLGLRSGTDLLVNGCSAGGLATWLHLDAVAEKVEQASGGSVKVLGIPECGFFMDELDANGLPGFTPLSAAVDKLQNATGSGSVNAGCLAAANGDDRSRCFMAQYTLPYVKTPFFAVNSVYDEWQGVNILKINPLCVRDPAQCTRNETAAYERLRSDMLGNLSTVESVVRGESSFFTYNCATHCGQFNHDDRWNELMNAKSSLTLRDAFGMWYQDVRGGEAAAGGGKASRDTSSAAPTGWGPKSSASCT